MKTPKKDLKRMKKYYAQNSERIKERNKKLWFSKPLKERQILARQRSVKYMYKLTPEQHKKLLQKQNFECPISGLPVNLFSHIDHDHNCCPGERSCGKCIRGILFGHINSSLGAFRKPEWLLKAYKYVSR